jgi:hypothetical protein
MAGEVKGEWPALTPAERELHAVVGAGLLAAAAGEAEIPDPLG